MKKITLLSLFLLVSFYFYAQNNSTAFENQDLNVFYVGVPNHLKIIHKKIPNKKLVVTISNGEIKKTDDCVYEVIVKTTENVKITVATKKGKILSEKEFRCKLLPNPVAVVNGKQGGIITIDELIKAEKVDLDLQMFPFDFGMKIESFVVSAEIEGFTQEYSTKGNKFSQDQKSFIQKLKENDKVYIENIKVIMPDGSFRKINSIAFKIREQNTEIQNAEIQIDETKHDEKKQD